MKDIKNFLTEASAKDGFDIKWKDSIEWKWKPASIFLSINIAEQQYNWVTEEDVRSWVDDGMDQSEVDEMLKTKVGDVYTPDGWNYYFRFKK